MCAYIIFCKPVIRVIVYCIYTPTGKREDLWKSHVKRPKVIECLGAYMSLAKCYICQEC